jgi:dTDP-4-dehydrorhamnose reductase
MKILLTGAAGQQGQALRQQVPVGVELIATSRSGGDGLLPLDLADAAACRRAVLEHRPDWVLNAGAYTAVDKAEPDQQQSTASPWPPANKTLG